MTARRATGTTPTPTRSAVRVVERVAELVAARPMPYCEGGGGRCYLHSQGGIDLDDDVTAGTRIPVGDEPPMLEHIMHVRAACTACSRPGSATSSTSTTRPSRNPRAVVDIIRGAFASGMRDFTFNLDSNEFVRITGYLVRKSDLAAIAAHGGARHAATSSRPAARTPYHLTGER